MKKNSAFTLRSGNRPSIAKLAGVSPVKNFVPNKPAPDKDKDGIPDLVDADAGSGKSNKTTQAKLDPKATKKTKQKPQDPVKPDGIKSLVEGFKKGLKNRFNKRKNNISNKSRNIGDLRNITHIPGFGLDR
jgi:hypothetical protein|tara:strand:+ start:36 stop:428 length:393 start_codon:yes stop_codon:yes gene_type:complete